MDYGFKPEKRVVTEKTPAVFTCGALLFYVASGSGTLHVNGVKLELGKGSFGWLHTYHIYQFEPEWGRRWSCSAVRLTMLRLPTSPIGTA